MKTQLTICLAWVAACTAASTPCSAEEEFSRQQLFSVIRNVEANIDPFSLPSKFKFPDNARASSTFGVDFSHHQEDACKCEYDWGGIYDQKVQFVYLKATQGLSYVDPSLKTNLPRVQKTRIEAGAYHFLSSADDATAQADFFLKTVQPFGALKLPSSLDLEWDAGPMRDDCPNDAVIKIRKAADEVVLRCDKWSFLSADEIIERVNRWLDKVKLSEKRDPVLYTSAAWWRARIGKRDRAKEISTPIFWVADYSGNGLATEKPGTPPGAEWTLWQFTDAAALPQVRSTIHIDASIFDGSIDKLHSVLHVN